jgi:hypothetical protein
MSLQRWEASMLVTDTAQQALDRRLDALRSAPAFLAYLEARRHVLAMLDAADDVGASEYWREELEGFEYLLDASPLLVDKLRHHSYHVTGLRPYDYRSNKGKIEAQVAAKLAALRDVAGGDDLLVPEPRALGGFGVEIDGDLYNVDTLKYFEVMIAMARGGVLDDLRTPGRKLVWEIGAGWGGFPFVFKSLFPDTTYVIVDLPPLYLFSATFLQTVFPDARFRFHDDVESTDALFADWEQYDFIVLPNTALSDMRPPRVDLTVNMVSFQEMTSQQVTDYVRTAYDLGSPYLYSLNRDRGVYNAELSNVHDIVGQWFWPRPVEVLDVSYVKWLDESKPKKGAAKAVGRENDYRHVIGWRRMEP